MLVLPSGMALPPLPYLLALVGGCVLVSALLFAVEPPIDQKLALAMAPWIAIGGALHAFYQLGAFTPTYAPLFGAPSVYLTTFVVTGFVWLVLSVVGIVRGKDDDIHRNMGFAGTGVLTVLFVLVAYQGMGLGAFDPVWPAISIVVALALTVVTIFLISIWRTPVFFRTRYVGPVVVFAHALDGVSTAVGADVIGVHERTPIPRAIMEFAGQLPTAEIIGVGWLFVAVKLVVSAAVVVAFNRYVDEDPAEATLVLLAVIGVGLGPAMNNLFLFLAGVA
ncbi:Uncharacterized membrane protein [Halomicrobium zhouii]|uniref:Uncharacterized membrane protein n=1 Tax=Halomicrobium zhouii TaxID=767519 RepID=A0A1I6KPR5_9EURY|nr:DUF63 family protein [Halomicrobium zhouii]SFR93242.1 Uncharacterized membrane protein [Halomicrobium zhouii]